MKTRELLRMSLLSLSLLAAVRVRAEIPRTAADLIGTWQLVAVDNEWLFPVNKVELLVTIEKQGPALTQVQARISEPFRVALGLARVLDVDLDVQMEPPPSVDPADAKPTGEARATVTKLGRRVEYYWTDFE